MNIWFELNQVLSSGQCGLLVTLLISLVDFVQTRKADKEILDAESFTQWIVQGQTKIITEHIDDLKKQLDSGPDGSELNEIISKLIHHMSENSNILNEILNSTSKIDKMDEKLDFIVKSLDKKDSKVFKKGQVAINAEVLNLLTKGLEGAGLKIVMNEPVDSDSGTIFIVWLTGSKSTDMILADYVGSIENNRISVLLNSNGSLSLRCYDSEGKMYEIKSEPIPSECQLSVFAIWEKNKVQFWLNEYQIGRIEMDSGFDYIGPVFLLGIDIEGKLSADCARWTEKNVDGNSGYNFQKNGIWHGSNMESAMVLSSTLNENQIKIFSDDPFYLIRPPDGNNLV